MKNIPTNDWDSLMIRDCVTKFIWIMRTTSLRDRYIDMWHVFLKYRGMNVLGDMNGYRFDYISDYIITIGLMYQYIGYSDNQLVNYLKYQNMSDNNFISMYNEYISLAMSYSSNTDFVMKMFNKIIVRTVYEYFILISKKSGDLNSDMINEKFVLDFLTSEGEDNIGNMLEKKLASPKIKETRVDDVDDVVIKKNLWDHKSDWKGVAIEVGDIKIEAKSQLISQKNPFLVKMFEQLVASQPTKFMKHNIIMRAAIEARSSESENQIPAILSRHIMIWLILSMIFQPKNWGLILKNYDFYWKNRERIQPLLDISDNEMWKGVASVTAKDYIDSKFMEVVEDNKKELTDLLAKDLLWDNKEGNSWEVDGLMTDVLKLKDIKDTNKETSVPSELDI